MYYIFTLLYNIALKAWLWSVQTEVCSCSYIKMNSCVEWNIKGLLLGMYKYNDMILIKLINSQEKLCTLEDVMG
jgi:hypothetical protein